MTRVVYRDGWMISPVLCQIAYRSEAFPILASWARLLVALAESNAPIAPADLCAAIRCRSVNSLSTRVFLIRDALADYGLPNPIATVRRGRQGWAYCWFSAVPDGLESRPHGFSVQDFHSPVTSGLGPAVNSSLPAGPDDFHSFHR